MAQMKWIKGRFLLASLAAIGMVSYSAITYQTPIIAEKYAAKVIRVVDGDTYVVQTPSEQITVRVIGVDTPELRDRRKVYRFYAKEAKQFASSNILGSTISYSYDKSKFDRYKRNLVYISLTNTDFGAEILKAGLARAREYRPNITRAEHYKTLEQAAKAKGLGMWGYIVTY